MPPRRRSPPPKPDQEGLFAPPRPEETPASPPPIRPAALTVSELVHHLRLAIESSSGPVWIKGEVTSFKSYASGHWYFTLRDAECSIRAIMWKTYAARVSAQPTEGAEVYALVAPTVWEERGELRVTVQVMLPTAGIGLQQLARERTLAALEKDGLLDPGRKRPLPEFPEVIAVVTSADGAALRDIIHVSRQRWPSVRLLVVPTKVQGEEAPADIVRALGVVNRLISVKSVDLCIVGRGGGSKEDLLAFDDERVCRAVAAVNVPTISAVGHETDSALTDLVADVRAATPSAAAERALPDRGDVRRHVGSLASRLAHGLRRRTGLVAARLVRSGDRIQAAMANRLAEPRADLNRIAGQLEALSPLKVLGRGYAVARLTDGRVARRKGDLPPGTSFSLRLSDGEVPSQADS